MKGVIVGRRPKSIFGVAINRNGKLYRLPESAQGQDPGKRCDFIVVKEYREPIEANLWLASEARDQNESIGRISGLARLA